MVELITKYLADTAKLNWREKLAYIAKEADVTFSTSFSIEDQIILDEIFKNDLAIEVFTLDTCRLPTDTYKLWQHNKKKYQKEIKAYYPDVEVLQEFVTKNGIDAFYDSKELRLNCCHIRKVEPLQRALAGKKIWISGLRREHSAERADKDYFEYDEALNIIKFYPILDLDEMEVWAEIKKHNIAYNKLYDEGYRSIGCAPCSRAVRAIDDVRAGRWWWESDEQKECGLHMVNGKLVRNKDVK